MAEIDPTFKVAFRIWWYWAWRTMVVAFIGSIILGILSGIVLGTLEGFLDLGLDRYYGLVGGALGWCFGLFGGLLLFKHFLIFGFGKYRLVIKDNS